MMKLLLLGNLGATELIVIVVLVLLLFGGKKIPELMRGVGKGVKSFREGIDGIDEDKPKARKTDDDKEQE